MITKIRKYQNSWVTKGILALTALSFMSLFGISGYVSSASNNRAVIKVDDFEILQNEMNFKHQDAIRKAQKMFGENIEITDEMRKTILNSLIKENLSNMIIAREAQKTNVSISDELIQKIISSQPEFMDASGRFIPELLRRRLSFFDMSEKEYINDLRQNIIYRHLVSSPVEAVKFPDFMNKYASLIANQAKTFNFIKIDPSKLSIDRSISEEEIEQYYDDFAPQFEEAENRDVSFMELKISDLSKNIIPDEEDIKAYYQENKSDYVVLEKRKLLQMVFDDEKTALEALTALKSGKDFYQVALEKASQDKATTDLGYVTSDSLLPELSEDVFSAKLNQFVGPINSEFGWHILKITQIKPRKETPLAKVKSKIIDTLRQERAYDEALNIVNQIEDEIGAGSDFATISQKYNSPILTVKSLKDDGSYKSLSNPAYKDIISSSDFLDVAFSYNENEISQTIESEDGFILAVVNKIHDAHLKDIKDVKPEIIKIWSENEKSAIAQEIINDIVADLDKGDSLTDIAKRFNLKVNTTKPLKRSEKFASLNATQLTEAYQIPLHQYKLLSSGGITTIVSPIKINNNTSKPSSKEIAALNQNISKDIETDLANALIDSYSSDMDVRVKYKLMGLEY